MPFLTKLFANDPRRLGVALGAASVFLFVAGHAAADPSADAAERRFQEGVAHFKTHDFEAAASSFGEAWAISQEERFLWNLALSELNAGDCAKAYGHVIECSRMPGISEAHREQLAAAMAFARSHLLLATVAAPRGAVVRVDGAAVGVAPIDHPVALEPREPHTIAASLAGVDDAKQVAPNGPGEIEIRLSPSPSTVAPTLVLSAAPASSPEMAPSSDVRTTRPVNVARVGASASALGLGLASGAVALGFYLDSRSQWNTMQGLSAEAAREQPVRPTYSSCFGVTSTTCASLQAANAAQVRDENLALGFAITGAGLLAVGTGLYFLWPKATRPGVATLAPVIGDRHIGGVFSLPLPL
jgi:hypothetical protein